jgi:hypothetical protein
MQTVKVKMLKEFTWNADHVKTGETKETEQHIAQTLARQGFVEIVAEKTSTTEKPALKPTNEAQ